MDRRRSRLLLSTPLLLLVSLGCGESPPDAAAAPAADVALAVNGSHQHHGDDYARLVAPLSGSLAGARRPTLRWAGPAEALVEICADRSCDHPLQTTVGSDHAARPRSPLPTGVVYWRVRGTSHDAHAAVTPVWELFVPPAGGAPDATRGIRYDADGDGFVDAAVRETDDVPSDVLHVYRGSPAGLLTHRQTQLTLDPGPGYGLATAGDVNGDGFGDLAVGDGRGVVIYAGSPEGVQQTPLNIIPSTEPLGVYALAAAGDVDGDGYGDLAVGDGMTTVQVYRGSATGLSATPAWTFTQSSIGRYAAIVTAADLNGDGFGDLVVQDYGSGGETQSFRFFRGSAAGLEPPNAGTQIIRPTLPYGSSGDVDGDGIPDLVTVEDTSLVLYLGGSSFPNPVPSQVLPLAHRPGPIQLGDFDGDGRFDVAANTSLPTSDMYFTDNSIDVYPGQPGGLSPTSVLTISETSIFPDNQLNFGSSLSSGDYDRRGHEDLLVGASVPFPTPFFDTSSGAIVVFPGSDGGLRAHPHRTVRGGPGYGVEATSSAPTFGGAF